MVKNNNDKRQKKRGSLQRLPLSLKLLIYFNYRPGKIKSLFLRSSRAGFYFFSTAKRSKQEMPSITQIPKNQNIFLKSENSPDLSFWGFWVETAKVYKTNIGIKQFGFLNEKCFDFLHGIWLKRFQARHMAPIFQTSVNPDINKIFSYFFRTPVIYFN